MIIKLVKNYFLENKFRILIYVVLSILLSFLGIVIPLISGSFIDRLISSPTMGMIYRFTFLYAFVAIIQITLSYICTMQATRLQSIKSYRFNTSVLNHLQKSPLSNTESNNLAYLNQRIYTDCTSLIQFTLSLLIGVVVNIFSAIISILIIVKVSIYMSVLILLLVIAYYILYKVMKNKLKNIKLLQKELSANYFSALQEQLNKVRMVKLFSLFNFFQRRLDNVFNSFLEVSLKNQRFSFLFLCQINNNILDSDFPLK